MYRLKYGPETLNEFSTLADAKDARCHEIANGAPRRIYIVRDSDGKRWH